MSIYNSRTYLESLHEVINEYDFLKKLEGSSVFVTGATGLICSALVDLLLYYSEKNGGTINVYAAGRNKEKTLDRFSRYFDKDYFHYVKYDAGKNNTFDFKCDYIIHGASNAFPAIVQKHPVDTMVANFVGMKELLDFVRETDVKNTVFISSSEVYGKKETNKPFKEDEYGFVDILNPRSSYPVSKRAAETLCISYMQEYEISVNIVRPGHIYGPTAGRADNRVSSAFAYDVVDGKDIVLKSDGSQIRSYCYMLDCASAILMVMTEGKKGEAYNISNKHSIMSIRRIAELFAKAGNVNLRFELPSEKEKAAFNPMINSSLDSGKLESLGWYGLYDSSRGTESTIKVISEM